MSEGNAGFLSGSRLYFILLIFLGIIILMVAMMYWLPTLGIGGVAMTLFDWIGITVILGSVGVMIYSYWRAKSRPVEGPPGEDQAELISTCCLIVGILAGILIWVMG